MCSTVAGQDERGKRKLIVMSLKNMKDEEEASLLSLKKMKDEEKAVSLFVKES